jgi:hypothetical protein
VGAWLASDLVRSASKTCAWFSSDRPLEPNLLPVPGRSLASQAPTPSGQNQSSQSSHKKARIAAGFFVLLTDQIMIS